MTQDEDRVQISLLTKQQIHAAPNVHMFVPASCDIQGLNDLVNQHLKKNQPAFLPKIFDFLINDVLVRETLKEHLQNNGISAEGIVNVEYIERIPPPEPQRSIQHDDWVKSVQAAGEWILTGCYDNTVNIWSLRGKLAVSHKAHSRPVRAVTWLKSGDPSKGFASVSQDETGILWEWEPGTNTVRPKISLRGHTKDTTCIAVSPDLRRLATGGWDRNLKVWSASLEEDHDEPSTKKSKKSSSTKMDTGLSVRTPLYTLMGHKEALTSLDWLDDQTVCTVSMDHSINLWDAEMCGLKHTLHTQKAILDCSWSRLNRTLITGSADPYLRMYDPRNSDTTAEVCKLVYKSHPNWVTSVCWSKYDENLFVSAGYDSPANLSVMGGGDCPVKMWDRRGPKAPLYDLLGHKGHVLAVDWSEDKFVVSGGNDSRVHVFKNKHVVDD